MNEFGVESVDDGVLMVEAKEQIIEVLARVVLEISIIVE